MNMKLVHKDGFKVIGFSAQISPEEGYVKCPEFWNEQYFKRYVRLWKTMTPEGEEEQAICDNHIGMLALCIDSENGFRYMISGEYQGGNVPEGMELYSLPESDWAVFSTKGPLPDSLQKLNTYVWEEWCHGEGDAFLPNGTATVEFYSAGDSTSADYECGIWIPIVSKMIAPCGLDCTKCDAYVATINDDNDLREKTAKLWAEANHAPITPEMINCTGCRGDGVKTPFCDSICEIRKCTTGKSLSFCSHCDTMNGCDKLKPIVENSSEAQKNLKSLKQY